MIGEHGIIWSDNYGINARLYVKGKDGVVEKLLVEPGKNDNIEDDPYSISTPENVMKYLKGEEYIETKDGNE